MLYDCLQTLHESCSITQSSIREKSVRQTLSKCHTLMKITQDEILGPLSNYLHNFLLAGIAVSFIVGIYISQAKTVFQTNTYT